MASWDDFQKELLVETAKLFAAELRAKANGDQVTGTASGNITARAEVSVRVARSQRILNNNIQRRRQVPITQQTKPRRSQPLQAQDDPLQQQSQPSASDNQPSTSKSTFTISQLKLSLWQPKTSIPEPQLSTSRQADLMASVAKLSYQLWVPLKPLMEYIREPPKPNSRGQRAPYYSYIDEDVEEMNRAIAADNAVWAVRRRLYKVPMTPIETYCNCGSEHLEDSATDDECPALKFRRSSMVRIFS